MTTAESSSRPNPAPLAAVNCCRALDYMHSKGVPLWTRFYTFQRRFLRGRFRSIPAARAYRAPRGHVSNVVSQDALRHLPPAHPLRRLLGVLLARRRWPARARREHKLRREERQEEQHEERHAPEFS